MKKIIVVLALALMAFTAKAQFYVGGSLGLNAIPGGAGGTTTATITLIPEAGYTLNDNMAVGGTIGWSNDWRYSAGNDSVFIVAPYFRYFFLDLGPVRLFADAQLELDFQTNAANNPATTTTFGVGVAPGIAIPVSEHISFVGHLGSFGYYNGSFGLNVDTNNFLAGVYYSF